MSVFSTKAGRSKHRIFTSAGSVFITRNLVRGQSILKVIAFQALCLIIYNSGGSSQNIVG
jgi:hypothetical protein